MSCNLSLKGGYVAYYEPQPLVSNVKKENMKFEDIKNYQVFKIKNDSKLYAKVNKDECFVFSGEQTGYMNYMDFFDGLTLEKVYNVSGGGLGNLMVYFKTGNKDKLILVWEADKYTELSKGDICEVWDDDDEYNKILVYYSGEGQFKVTVNDDYPTRYDNFKLIKKAE